MPALPVIVEPLRFVVVYTRLLGKEEEKVVAVVEEERRRNAAKNLKVLKRDS